MYLHSQRLFAGSFGNWLTNGLPTRKIEIRLGNSETRKSDSETKKLEIRLGNSVTRKSDSETWESESESSQRMVHTGTPQ